MADNLPAVNNITEAEVFGPVGYLSICLAHIRAGHPIEDLDTGLVLYVTPTQTEVDQARRMAHVLAEFHPTGSESP